MKDWANMTLEEKIESYRMELEETDEWISDNWGKLPEYIQSMVVRGMSTTKTRIEEIKRLI